jgi:hypothetical protein
MRQQDLDSVLGCNLQKLIYLFPSRREGGCRSFGKRHTKLKEHVFLAGFIMRITMGGMPSDRIDLLRILSNLDQSMAKIETIIEREKTYDGWQVAIQVRARLEVAHTRAVDALKRMV